MSEIALGYQTAQIMLTIDNTNVLNHVKTLLKQLKGVHSVRSVQPKHKKTGLDLAIEDIKAGRVTEYASVDDMFSQLGICTK